MMSALEVSLLRPDDFLITLQCSTDYRTEGQSREGRES